MPLKMRLMWINSFYGICSKSGREKLIALDFMTM